MILSLLPSWWAAWGRGVEGALLNIHSSARAGGEKRLRHCPAVTLTKAYVCSFHRLEVIFAEWRLFVSPTLVCAPPGGGGVGRHPAQACSTLPGAAACSASKGREPVASASSAAALGQSFARGAGAGGEAGSLPGIAACLNGCSRHAKAGLHQEQVFGWPDPACVPQRRVLAPASLPPAVPSVKQFSQAWCFPNTLSRLLLPELRRPEGSSVGRWSGAGGTRGSGQNPTSVPQAQLRPHSPLAGLVSPPHPSPGVALPPGHIWPRGRSVAPRSLARGCTLPPAAAAPPGGRVVPPHPLYPPGAIYVWN